MEGFHCWPEADGISIHALREEGDPGTNIADPLG